MMKKILIGVITVVIVLGLCACGGGGGNDGGGGGGAVKGEVYDAGNVSVLVPDGWMAVPTSDIFDEYDGDYDPYRVSIYKGADSEWDAFTCPGVNIVSYKPTTTVGFESTKAFYDDVQDLEPMTFGNYTYEGFSAVSMDVPITTLLTTGNDDGAQVQVTLWTEMDEGTISLDDPDVQAILESIAVVNE